MIRISHIHILTLLITFAAAISTSAQAPTITSFTPASGGTYSEITIKGTNFTGATAVKFGDSAALYFFVDSANTIRATVGFGASGNVTVTNPSGTATKPGFTFVLPPNITSFSPVTGGAGTVVTIHGAHLTGATAVQFGVTNAYSFTVMSDSTINATVGSGSSGNVTVTTPYGSAYLPGFTHNVPTITRFSPRAGGEGSVITITGSNFTGTYAVIIGYSSASSFTIVSPSTITAVVPGGSIDNIKDTIKVITPNGIARAPGFNITTINNFTPISGTIGTSVTITGFNFTGTTDVKFGGVPASSFTLIGDTIITAVVGTGTSGPVSVTTGYGTATNGFFSFVLPVPQIFYFSPDIGGPGTVVTIQGRNFNGTTTVKFGDTAASSFTVVADSLITAVVGNGASGRVKVTSTYGSDSSSAFIFATVPTITTFSPESGPIGTIVTINGANFGTTPASNTVRFGAVQANVLTASSNAVTAVVPAGASYDPITLSTGNYTASTSRPFLVTFPVDPGDSSLAGGLSSRVDFTAGNLPQDVVTGDFDGDGKPEVVAANYGNNTVSVFRNTGSMGVISFAAKTDFATGVGPRSVATADINGDGKLDIALATQSGVTVLKNTGSPGNISFASMYNVSTVTGSTGNQDIAIADFDGDGRQDIAVANSDYLKVTVFRNTTTGGTISLTPVFDHTSGHPVDIAAGDLNGDGKPEIVVVNAPDGDVVPGVLSIFKNTSSSGSVSFTLTNYNNAGADFTDVTVGDLDGDIKQDLALTNQNLKTASVLRNTSTIATISFAALENFSTSGTTNSISAIKIADVNGDQKPDLAVVITDTLGNSGIAVLKNAGSTGIISFNTYINYVGGDNPVDLSLNDLDLDGKPDVIFPNSLSQSVAVLRNSVGLNLLQLCSSSSGSALTASITGTNYQWQVNTGTGFNTITDNSNYNGTTTSVLHLNSIPDSWYGYKFRCVTDGNNGEMTEVRFRNFWTGTFNTQWENPANWSCGTVPSTNTDVIISSGTVILSSNTTIRNLILTPGVSFTINPVIILTITH